MKYNIFPFWPYLQESEQLFIKNTIQVEKFNKGMQIYRNRNCCKGLMAVLSGRLRAFILSEEGREVTLFWVQNNEVCVLSASCLMDSISFDVMLEATEETRVAVIPSGTLNQIMAQNPSVELYLYKKSKSLFFQKGRMKNGIEILWKSRWKRMRRLWSMYERMHEKCNSDLEGMLCTY